MGVVRGAGPCLWGVEENVIRETGRWGKGGTRNLFLRAASRGIAVGHRGIMRLWTNES